MNLLERFAEMGGAYRPRDTKPRDAEYKRNRDDRMRRLEPRMLWQSGWGKKTLRLRHHQSGGGKTYVRKEHGELR